jgi:hypothetical protein
MRALRLDDRLNQRRNRDDQLGVFLHSEAGPNFFFAPLTAKIRITITSKAACSRRTAIHMMHSVTIHRSLGGGEPALNSYRGDYGTTLATRDLSFEAPDDFVFLAAVAVIVRRSPNSFAAMGLP